MKAKTKATFAFAAIFALPLLFQNCAPGFQTAEDMNLSSNGELFNPDGKGNPFVCSDISKPSSSPLTRLTRAQYSNTLLSALGSGIQTQLQDSITTLYEDLLSKSIRDFRPKIDETQMTAYQGVAEKAYFVVKGTAAYASALAGSCITATTVTAECKANFVKSFGKKMFRRPLLDTEVNKFTSQVFNKGDNAIEGVALTVYALMLEPDFLMRLELGNSSDASTAAVFNLSPYEVASRLSYLLWDAPPDDALMKAADENKLATPSQVSQQVDRMMLDSRAKVKIRDFFRFWLDPKKFPASAYSAAFLNGYDVNAANAEFEREMYEFIDYVVFQKNGTFNDLLNSNESFARTPLVAQTYGHSPVSGAAPAQMDANRKGLLMRAPVIATEGNETHPILRGVKFKRQFLCDTLGLPSGVMTSDPTFFSDTARMRDSTRTRTAGITASESCMACHSSINPFGFALENFDGVGRVRAKERSFSTVGNFLAEFPIDTKVDALIIEPGTSFPINDGKEVIDHMLAGNKVPACFVQQIYRYYSMKLESPADGCQLNSMYNRIKTEDYNNKPLLSVFKELFIYPSVFKRSLN